MSQIFTSATSKPPIPPQSTSKYARWGEQTLLKGWLCLHSELLDLVTDRSMGKALLGRYDQVPYDLFRVNGSPRIVLRDYEVQQAMGKMAYDLHLKNGLVMPAESEVFEGPNGASLRPDGRFLQQLIRGFPAKNGIVYRLPAGVKMPSPLTLLHEHSDHFSIQATLPISLGDLNSLVTNFLQRNGELMSMAVWCERYPSRH